MNTTSIDEPLRLENNATVWGQTGTFFYQRTVLGSICALADTNGAVVERYTYDAYGAPQFESANGTPIAVAQSQYGNPLLFHAMPYAAAPVSACDYRTRTYCVHIGRFAQRDPIGVWGDEIACGSAYAFIGSQPHDRTDPFGLHDLNLIPTYDTGRPKGIEADRWSERVKSDIQLAGMVDRARLSADTFTVAAHGSPVGGKVEDSNRVEISAKKMAGLIKANPKFKGNPNITVVMSTCFGGYAASGNQTDTYAQQLADELGVPVIAANYYVRMWESEHTYQCLEYVNTWQDGKRWLKFRPRNKDGVVPTVEVQDPRTGDWKPGSKWDIQGERLDRRD